MQNTLSIVLDIYDDTTNLSFKDWYGCQGFEGSVRVYRGKMVIVVDRSRFSHDKDEMRTGAIRYSANLFCRFFDACIAGSYSTDREMIELIDLKFMLFTDRTIAFFCWLEDNGYEHLYMSASDLGVLANEFHFIG